MAASQRGARSLVLSLICLGAVGLGLFFTLRASPALSIAEARASGDIDNHSDEVVSLVPPADLRRVVGPASPAPEHDSATARPDPSPEEDEEESEEGLVLEGVVRSTAGPGIEGAEVRFGSALAVTGEDGFFELEVPYVMTETPVIATKHGYEPAVIPGFGAIARACTGSLEPVELILGSSPGKLRGRLVSAQGETCPGWEIDLYDASPVAPNVSFGPSAEDIAGDISNRQLTDADGYFRMAGLRSDRTYRLHAQNQDTLQSFVSETIAPGVEEFTFVVDLEAVHSEVHGVVIGHDGVPLPGIKVRLSMFVDERELDGVVHRDEGHTGQTVYSDESGRFSFRDVPHENVFLRFHGGHVAAAPYWFRADSPVHDLRITLGRQGRFQLEFDAAPADRPDALEVWDVHGETIAVKTSGAYPPPGRIVLPAGDLPAYRTTDDARWLVLYREGREIGRREMQIRAAETVKVTF